MLIKRVDDPDIRLKPGGCVDFFLGKNGDKYIALKEGKTIEVPDKAGEEIVKRFEGSVVVVTQPTKPSVEPGGLK